MTEPGFPEFKPGTKKIIQERAPLREGISQIAGQLVGYGEGGDEFEELREQIGFDDVRNIDLENGDLEALKESGCKNSGPGSYLISPIKEDNLCSDKYFNCTAVVAIGRDAATGKEVSFLSHQSPEYFVDGGADKTKMFEQELGDSLRELKARSQSDTVEVLLLGGNFNPAIAEGDYQHRHYKQSIEKLRQIVQETLGFDPKVLTGPNYNVGSETSILVETQKRKVWVERTKQPPEFDQPYMANALDVVEKNWLKAGE